MFRGLERKAPRLEAQARTPVAPRACRPRESPVGCAPYDEIWVTIRVPNMGCHKGCIWVHPGGLVEF